MKDALLSLDKFAVSNFQFAIFNPSRANSSPILVWRVGNTRASVCHPNSAENHLSTVNTNHPRREYEQTHHQRSHSGRHVDRRRGAALGIRRASRTEKASLQLQTNLAPQDSNPGARAHSQHRSRSKRWGERRCRWTRLRDLHIASEPILPAPDEPDAQLSDIACRRSL